MSIQTDSSVNIYKKKSEFLHFSKEEIITIQNRLNHRPRKVPGYKTPYEVFFNEMSKKLAS